MYNKFNDKNTIINIPVKCKESKKQTEKKESVYFLK
jgi:hypothetical protein